MVKVGSVYGRLGLAASPVDSAMDLRQNNGVCTSVNLVLATASGNVCACVKLAGKHLLTGNRNGRKTF